MNVRESEATPRHEALAGLMSEYATTAPTDADAAEAYAHDLADQFLWDWNLTDLVAICGDELVPGITCRSKRWQCAEQDHEWSDGHRTITWTTQPTRTRTSGETSDELS